MQAHPDARSYRVKTVPSYHKLCIIYGEDSFDGRYSRLACNVDEESEVPLLSTGIYYLGLDILNIILIGQKS